MHFVGSMSSFSVPDVEKAREFYGGTLGFETSVNEMGILEITLPGGGRAVAYPKPDHQPATFTVLNLLVEDIDASVDELTRAGVGMEHYDTEPIKTDAKGIARDGDGAICWFKDPAGNILSLIQFSPR